MRELAAIKRVCLTMKDGAVDRRGVDRLEGSALADADSFHLYADGFHWRFAARAVSDGTEAGFSLMIA
jgi:hypothetical protein